MSNKDKTEKISLRETANLSLRGFGIWWNNYPKLILSVTLRATLDGLTPYVGIYLSALIIGEIAGARDPATLSRLVLISLISAAVITLLSAVVKRWSNCQWAAIWYATHKLFAKNCCRWISLRWTTRIRMICARRSSKPKIGLVGA